MSNPMVTIEKEEYTKLVLLAGRADAFKGLVLASSYSIDREVCAAMFDFELGEQKDAETDRKQNGC